MPKDEIPGWLKDKIAQDEKIIESDPKLMQSYGAWIRYAFEDDYYYEYDNPLSSVIRNLYSEDGDSVDTTVASLTDYGNEKSVVRDLFGKPPNIGEL